MHLQVTEEIRIILAVWMGRIEDFRKKSNRMEGSEALRGQGVPHSIGDGLTGVTAEIFKLSDMI